MDWITEKTLSETLVILRELTSQCYLLANEQSLNGAPLTKELVDLVDAERYLDVVNYKFDYSSSYLLSVECINDYRYARQVQGFYQKLADLNLGIDKEAVAFRTWREAEDTCLNTNIRLRSWRRNPSQMSSDLHVVLHHAQRKIASILGRLPDPSVLSFSFGPGANTSVKSSCAFPRGKLSARLQCSHEFVPAASDLLSEVPAWIAQHAHEQDDERFVVSVDVVPGKLVFVPKNAKTMRSIIVEPVINSFFQKGYGSYIRERLLSCGIDLRDQTRNQFLACQGSVYGDLATMDLSSASDTISKEVVKELLPIEWYDTLERLRTRTVVLPDGTACVQDKFSSMGNAYTFELESLIFYSLAYGVCRLLHKSTEMVSVYGDDIIIPSTAFGKLSSILTQLGFSVNQEKSYATGGFRESCGADFLHGSSVRPYYQKSLISGRTLFTMHNFFVRSAEMELARVVAGFIPDHLKLWGPDGYGDGHLIGSYTLRQSRNHASRGFCGGYFETYTLKPRRVKRPFPGDAVLPVYSVYTRSGKDSPTDPNVVRGSQGYAKVTIYTFAENVFRKE